MSKRPSVRGISKKPKSPRVNPSEMLGQMQKMQEDMAVAQAELENELMTVTAGGGAISIVISGHQRVKGITIDPELLQAEEVDLLQDMLVAAVNSAIEQSQAMAAERMEGLTGGVDTGGIGDLLGQLGAMGGM